MSFWNDPQSLEPLRQHRFLLSLAGKNQSIQNYVVKKAGRPGFENSQSEHKFLNHTFKFPGKTTFKDITVELVDIIEPSTSVVFWKMLEESGYRAPEGPVEPGLPTAKTLSKRKAVEAFGIPILRTIDAEGETILEYRLHNAWIKEVDLGEHDYGGEDLMGITITVAFDFPSLQQKLPNSTTVPSNAPT